MNKQVKFIKVDGVTVAQLYINGKFHTEIDLYTGYSREQAKRDLLSIKV